MRSLHLDHKQIIIAVLAIAAPIAVNAQPFTGGDLPHVQPQSHAAGNSHNQRCKIGGGLFRFLNKLDLSESQQYRIFSVIYAQVQILNKQDKIVRNAYIDLHKIATSEQYDEGKAEAIGESLAKAKAAIALVRAQGSNRIYDVLTTEQLNSLRMLQAGQPDAKQKCSFKQRNGSFGLLPFHIF